MPLPEREEETTGSENARPADGARLNGPPTDDDLRAALPRGWLQAIRGTEDHPDPPARLRGRYNRRLQLGRGGMGGVWRYFDTHTRRDVAIKFAFEGREDALREEVEILAQLDHPSIPRALDAGDDGGITFAVFPLIEGPTLHAMITARRPSPDSLHEEVGATRPSDRPSPGGATPSTKAAWPVRPADSITQPAADDDAPPAPPSKAEAVRLLSAFRDLTTALGAMHRRGLLHIDIKPANIMLGPDGRGYLIDFGLASGSDGGEDGGARGGTPHYMSPEQASGVGGLDFRSDIYSLGVTLHEGLTGVRVVRPPDGLGTRARADWIKSTVTTTPVPKLTTVAPSLREILGKDTTAALEAVLDKACRKNPAERYATAESLDSDLARAAAGREPERAVAPRFVRRRRLTIAAAAATVLFTAAFALRTLYDAEQRRMEVDGVSAELTDAKAKRGPAGDLLPVWESIGARRQIIEGDLELSAQWRTFVDETSDAFAAEAILGQCLTIYDAGSRLAPRLRTTVPRHRRYATAAASLRGFRRGRDSVVDVVEAFGAYVDCRFADVDRLLARCADAEGVSAQLRSTLIICAGFPRMQDGVPDRNETIKTHMSSLGIDKDHFAPDTLEDLPLACAAFVYIAGHKYRGLVDRGRSEQLTRRLLARIEWLAETEKAERNSPLKVKTRPLPTAVLRTLAARLAFGEGRYAETLALIDAGNTSELSPDNFAAVRILRGTAALKFSVDTRPAADSRSAADGRAAAGERWRSDLAEGLSAAPAALGSLVGLLLATPARFWTNDDAKSDTEADAEAKAEARARAEAKATSEVCLAALEAVLFDPQFRWFGEQVGAESFSSDLPYLAIAAIAGISHDDKGEWARVAKCLFAYVSRAVRPATIETGSDALLAGHWVFGVVDDALSSKDYETALRAAQTAHDGRIGVPSLIDTALGRAHASAAENPDSSPEERRAHHKKAREHLLAAKAEDTGLPGVVAKLEDLKKSLSADDPRREDLSAHIAQLKHILEQVVLPSLSKIPPDGP